MVVRVRRPARVSDDLMRSVGGLLFAIGAVALLSRKAGPGHHWSKLAQLLIVLVPALALYALALARSRPRARRPAEPDQTVLVVGALLLSPVVFLEFLRWVGASTNGRLEIAGVFAAAALLAVYATWRARVTYAVFLAGVSTLVSWLLVWDKILDHPSASTFRWLLIAFAAILLFAAGALSLGGAPGAGELATVGGLAAVGAGIVGVVVAGLLGATRTITASVGGSGEGAAVAPIARHISGAQHLGWDIYLLVVSLAFVWVGSRVRARGLGYVGALGLVAFLISVGTQLARISAGHARSTDVVGWPLVLLLVGVAGLALGSLGRPSRSTSRE